MKVYEAKGYWLLPVKVEMTASLLALMKGLVSQMGGWLV